MLSDSTLGEFFRAAIDIPEIPFGEMLWESAQRFPEKVALVFQGQKISYRELDGLANSFANALLGNFSSYTETSNAPYAHWGMTQVEWYVQDNWRVSRRLTLD